MGSMRGGTVGSVDELRKSLKKSGGGTGNIKYIPAEGGITVRFLTEPGKWVKWFKHWSNGAAVGCTEGCALCADGDRPATRYLAAAIDTGDGNNVIALELPVSVAQTLLNRYDKYGTLLDRDYEICKYGEGKEHTRYEATPEAPTRMNLRGYDVPDLEEVLESSVTPDDDDDAESKPSRRVAKKTPAKKTVAKKTASASSSRTVRRRPSVMDEDFDDDEGEDAVTGRPLRNKPPIRKPVRRTIRRS